MGTFVRKDSASSRKSGADADTPGQAWGFGVGLRADAWAGGPASSSPARPCPRPVVPASWSSAGGRPFLPGAQGSARTPTRALATSPPDAAASESRPAPPGRAMPRAGSLWIGRPRCSSAALANRLLSAAALPAVLALDRLSSRAEGSQSPSRHRKRVFKDRSLESVFIRRTSSGRGVIEDGGAGAVRRLSPGDPAPPAGRRTPGPVSSRAHGAGVTCDRETSSAAVTGIRWEFVASFHFLKTFPFDPLM